MSKLLAGVVILLLLCETLDLAEANVTEKKIEWVKRLIKESSKAFEKKLPKTLIKVTEKALGKILSKILESVQAKPREELSKLSKTDPVKTFVEELLETLIKDLAEEGATFVGSMVCGPICGIAGKI